MCQPPQKHKQSPSILSLSTTSSFHPTVDVESLHSENPSSAQDELIDLTYQPTLTVNNQSSISDISLTAEMFSNYMSKTDSTLSNHEYKQTGSVSEVECILYCPLFCHNLSKTP